MRLDRVLRGRARPVASVLSVVLVASTVVVLAVTSEGYSTADVDLNDASVWVTNSSTSQVGRLNDQIQELDSSLLAATADFDVLQEAATVLVHEPTAATLTPVDIAEVVLTDPAEVPAGAVLALGGGVVAALDPATGALRTAPATALSSLAPTADPLAELGPGATVTVGSDGTVHAVSPQRGELLDYAAGAGAPTVARLEGLGGTLTATAVGADAVVLDSETGRLWLPDGGTVQLPESTGAVLQQAGEASDAVRISTSTALLTQPLDGGSAQVQPAGGSLVVAPVRVAGCTYAAWGGASPRYVRDCTDDGQDLDRDVPGSTAASVLRFRVNRQVVVLNDTTAGDVWLVQQAMERVSNWAEVTPPPEDGQEEDETTEDELDSEQQERTEENTAPEATDDDLGVRPGRTTVLPVLDNDVDPDGDVLTAALSGEQPAGGALVQPVRNGAALQVVVPPDAAGTLTFSYTAADGRGGSDDAVVTLTVRPEELNEAPEQKREATVLATTGATVEYNVLPDWSDPDGDDLFLVSAAATTPGDTVRTSPDGRLTFVDAALAPGVKPVTVVVSDGREQSSGTLRVNVLTEGATPPVANADHVVTTVGTPVTASPLGNDVSPSGAPLRLAGTDDPAGLVLEKNFDAGTVSITAPAAGTYYLTYQVTNGPGTADGLVRVDVLEPSTENQAPVAVNDLALLPSGGSVLTDVLVNDVDPAGGVLVVQSLSVPAGAGVSVALLENRVLRILDSALTAPVTLTYTVTNGIGSATGQVRVLPVPAPATFLPPVALADTATVRAGDVVTIPVLANDSHPNGLELTLVGELVESPDPAAGTLFAAERTLRFQASDTPGTVYAVYQVADSRGQRASAQVTITVQPLDPERNAPPRPRDLTARVLAGSEVRIPVPLDGLDPDGDSVRLTGLDRAPAVGRIEEVGAGFLRYSAPAGSAGQDSFTYAVTDRLGAKAVATVRVGISAPPPSNQTPAALPDEVTVRPDRDVAVAVLTNDSDADGDRLVLELDGLVAPPGVQATVSQDRVELRTPTTDGTLGFYYDVTDGRGGRATGALSVVVSATADLLAPIARDDVLTAADVEGRTDVTVAVLDNDEDPDGSVTQLQMTTGSPSATVQGDGTVRVVLADTAQIIRYTITDQDGLSASAFLDVPGTTDQAPSLVDPDATIAALSEQPVTLSLTELVRVAPGKAPRLTRDDRVTATNGAVRVLDATSVEFTSTAGFFGTASVSFEVTDGTGPDDPAGRTAVLSVGVVVAPLENQPPTFAGSAVEISAGEDATSVDLRTFAADPDPGDVDRLSFRLTGEVPGVTATLSGSTLSLAAGVDAPRGPAGSLTVEVSDGTSAPATGQLPVSVVATTRPLASANDDVIPDAQQGRAEQVAALANDTNPFPDTPLTLVSAVVETGDGAAAVAGDAVTVTPGGDFVGTLVVRYRVADATGDPDREVDGRISLTVQGRPGAPSVPLVQEVRDRTVVLSWGAPTDNGSPITGYTVSGTGVSQECPATTCTLEGLTNDREYTFTVTATNAVGESDPSTASAVARPDARPDTPLAPTLQSRDGALAVTWVAPRSPGSPITSYTLEISPAPPSEGSRKTGLTGTTYTWTGLTNGTAYTVSVQAVNRAPEPSAFSPFTPDPVTPAGVPTKIAQPTGVRGDDGVNGGVLTVRWTPPASDNGAAIESYELNGFKNEIPDPATSRVLGSDSTDTRFTNLTTNARYSFTLSARNSAGLSAPSEPSEPSIPYGRPGAVTDVRTLPGNGEITVSFTPPDDNGNTINNYSVSVNGGPYDQTVFPEGTPIATDNRSTQGYTFAVVAENDAGVGDRGPATAPSFSSGPVGQPTVEVGPQGGIFLDFSWGGADSFRNSRTMPRVTASWSDSRGQGGDLSSTTSARLGNSPDVTVTVTVTACDDSGCKSGTGTGRTGSRDVVMSEAVGNNCGTPDEAQYCRNIVLTLRNFTPGSNPECVRDLSSINNPNPQRERLGPINSDGTYARRLSWFFDNRRFNGSFEASQIRCDGVQAHL